MTPQSRALSVGFAGRLLLYSSPSYRRNDKSWTFPICCSPPSSCCCPKVYFRRRRLALILLASPYGSIGLNERFVTEYWSALNGYQFDFCLFKWLYRSFFCSLLSYLQYDGLCYHTLSFTIALVCFSLLHNSVILALSPNSSVLCWLLTVPINLVFFFQKSNPKHQPTILRAHLMSNCFSHEILNPFAVNCMCSLTLSVASEQKLKHY